MIAFAMLRCVSPSPHPPQDSSHRLNFSAVNVEESSKRKSRWEIACWRIKGLHRMPGRPHYPPYWASSSYRSPAHFYHQNSTDTITIDQCVQCLLLPGKNYHQCIGNGASLPLVKVFDSTSTLSQLGIPRGMYA